MPAFLDQTPQQQRNAQELARLQGMQEKDSKYTIEGLRESLFKRLVKYIDSRASISTELFYKRKFELFESSQAPRDVIDHLNKDCADKCSIIEGFSSNLRKLRLLPLPDELLGNNSKRPTDILEGKAVPQDSAFRNTKTGKEYFDSVYSPSGGAYWNLNVSYTKEFVGSKTYITFHTKCRDEELTKDRVNLLLKLVFDLENKQYEKRDANDNRPGLVSDEEKIKNISLLIERCIVENRQYNDTSLNRNSDAHHVHVTGSRFPFFGSGTWFQSQAEIALMDCFKLVEKTKLARNEVQLKIDALTPNNKDLYEHEQVARPTA